ncbi:hypothetical protein HZU67_02542 [Apis mellifera carnica]|nr:hypothetical protein HZU67_02542 [Apis mellifera carnica]
MIQLVGGESGFPRARKPRRRKIEARPSTKVASTSLKRVTEAEPTFASAWNRATRGSFSRSIRGIGQGTEGRKIPFEGNAFREYVVPSLTPFASPRQRDGDV